jgi:hypothetical protein
MPCHSALYAHMPHFGLAQMALLVQQHSVSDSANSWLHVYIPVHQYSTVAAVLYLHIDEVQLLHAHVRVHMEQLIELANLV